MKRYLYIILLLIIFGNAAKAQSIIAKIKYEDAEAFYANGDDTAAIRKLDEAEKLLGRTNPKILYLRIMAQSRLVHKSPYSDVELLISLRKIVSKYLKEYETIPNNEDKYKEVYRVSESLEQYPATTEALYQHVAAEAERAGRPARYADSLLKVNKFKAGLTVSEFKLYNPEAAFLIDDKFKIKSEANDKNRIVIYQRAGFVGPYFIKVVNGFVESYAICLRTGLKGDEWKAASLELENEFAARMPAYVESRTGRLCAEFPNLKMRLEVMKDRFVMTGLMFTTL